MSTIQQQQQQQQPIDHLMILCFNDPFLEDEKLFASKIMNFCKQKCDWLQEEYNIKIKYYPMEGLPTHVFLLKNYDDCPTTKMFKNWTKKYNVTMKVELKTSDEIIEYLHGRDKDPSIIGISHLAFKEDCKLLIIYDGIHLSSHTRANNKSLYNDPDYERIYL